MHFNVFRDKVKEHQPAAPYPRISFPHIHKSKKNSRRQRSILKICHLFKRKWNEFWAVHCVIYFCFLHRSMWSNYVRLLISELLPEVDSVPDCTQIIILSVRGTKWAGVWLWEIHLGQIWVQKLAAGVIDGYSSHSVFWRGIKGSVCVVEWFWLVIFRIYSAVMDTLLLYWFILLDFDVKIN